MRPALLLTAVLALVLTGCRGASSRPEDPVTHVVLVWLKQPGDVLVREQLIATSREFSSIPGVMSVRAGEPLDAEARDVVDASFDVAIVMTFESPAALESYLTHPNHVRAVEEQLGPAAGRIVVYDFVD